MNIDMLKRGTSALIGVVVGTGIWKIIDVDPIPRLAVSTMMFLVATVIAHWVLED